MGGTEYRDGFTLTASKYGPGVALFNLGKQYMEMELDVGKVDTAEFHDVKLNVYLNGESVPSEQYSLSSEKSFTHLKIKLNNASDLKLELSCSIKQGWGTQYGFYNIVLDKK